MLNELAVAARDRAQARSVLRSSLPRSSARRCAPRHRRRRRWRGADIVVTATGSAEPVLKHAWLAPGAHVNAMGANAANRREVDADCVLKASLVVTDHIEQAKMEAAEFIDLAKAGRFDWNSVKPLHQIVTGPPIERDAKAHHAVQVAGRRAGRRGGGVDHL